MCAHAMAHFAMNHRPIFEAWTAQSDFLAVLAVRDETALDMLRNCCEIRGITMACFYEPDRGDQLMAIALEPSEEATRLTSQLPLALRTEPSPVAA